jgi:hypothetical protein
VEYCTSEAQVTGSLIKVAATNTASPTRFARQEEMDRDYQGRLDELSDTTEQGHDKRDDNGICEIGVIARNATRHDEDIRMETKGRLSKARLKKE